MFLQFELWKQCSMNCKFCYNNGIKFKRDKIKSMQQALEVINSEEINKYDTIGFISGEFFNGEISSLEEHILFYKLINKIIDLLKADKLKRCLITSSLMYSDNTKLIEFCDCLKEAHIENKFMICTSYDMIGRFDASKLKNWQTNMYLLKSLYPDLKLHVEMIVTEFFLKSILNDKLNLNDFKKKYNCEVDYIVPFIGYGKKHKTKQDLENILPGFFPRRETFLEFLSYVYENNIFSLQNLKDFININLHSDTVYMSFDDETVVKIDNRHKLENKDFIKINMNNGGYLDSNIHPRQDVEDFINIIGE